MNRIKLESDLRILEAELALYLVEQAKLLCDKREGHNTAMSMAELNSRLKYWSEQSLELTRDIRELCQEIETQSSRAAIFAPIN